MNIEYNDFSNDDALQSFTRALGSKAENEYLKIPERYGTGFMLSKNFSTGVSAFITDVDFKETLYSTRKSTSPTQSFMLSFNKKIITPAKADNRRSDNDTYFNVGNSIVRLVSSMTPSNSILPGNTRILNVSIFFTKDVLYKFFEHDVIEEFMNIYYTMYLKPGYTIPLDASCHGFINELFAEMHTHPLQNIFIETRLMLLLETFFINFITKDQHNARKLRFKLDDIGRLVEAENMLLANFSEPAPTIEVLSKACAMSPTKFKSDFKAMYGLPVYEYYQKNRMAHARQLIRDGRYSLAEVGLKVGYSNLGHFAAAFKKEFNMLPKDWRQANKFNDALD